MSQPAPFHARVARPSVERAAQQFGLSATAVARVKEIVAEIAEDGGGANSRSVPPTQGGQS